MRAEIIGKDGNELRIKLFDELTDEEVERYKIGDRLFAVVELFDPDSITNEQRRHIYALLGDFSDYTGYTLESVESLFKVKFMHFEMMDELPSFGTNRMTKTMAGKFIEYLIIWYIQNGIPFRKQQFYLTTDVSKMLYAMTMRRLCWVCGVEHSEIHHATNLVGMGNDRNKHNHLKSKFMCLCVGGNDIEDETKMASHHDEVHKLGLTNFMNKYHVRPIKLSEKDLKKLGIRGDYTK